MLKNLKFTIIAGGLAEPANYMEAIPGDKKIFVNAAWLQTISKLKDNKNQNLMRAMHSHLLLQKSLHEVAHLLTSDMMAYCDEKKAAQKESTANVNAKATPNKTTPVEIGKMYPNRSSKAIGDAGFGFEEFMTGGRMGHISDGTDAFSISQLVLLKKVRRSWKTYTIPKSFTETTPMNLGDYRPKRLRLQEKIGKGRKKKKAAFALVSDHCLHELKKGGYLYAAPHFALNRKA